MPIDVQMPDGTIISGVPDNITQADLLARYKAFSPSAEPPKSGSSPLVAQPEPIFTPEERMAGDPALAQPSGSGSSAISDIGKLFGAGAVKGIAGAPEAVQQAATVASRETATKPSEILNLFADPRLAANKMVETFGFNPIFEIEKPVSIVPNELVKRQSAALDETFTKGKIPALTALTNYGSKVSKELEESVSPEMKDAMASTEPTGNLVKALGSGDFSQISFGKDPSAQGLIGQAAKVFGSSGTALALGLLTRSPTVGGAAGFGMAGSEGVDTAKEYIEKMSDQELNQNSEYFRNLVVLGYDKKTAREMTIDKASSTAAFTQGLVGALGGQFTTKLVTGQFNKPLIEAARQRLGAIAENRAARIAGGVAIGAAEEGLQELAEGIATDLSIDRTVVREIGVDSFANLVLGAIGGSGPGAISGAMAKETPEQPPTGEVTAPIAPVPFTFEQASTPTVAPVDSTAPRAVPPSESQDTQAMIDEFRSIGMPPAEPAPEPMVAPAVEPTTPAEIEPSPPPEVAQPPVPVEPAANVWESIQNRDRSTPASIAQMAKIANEPDYSRVSMSRDYGTGAPIVAGAEVDPVRLGRTDVVTGADGKKVPIQYGVIEAGEVIPSHNADGTKNPSYVDQNVPAFRAITNGRVAGLQAAYNQGTAADYREALLSDDLHGIDRNVIEGMQNPMLVRVMPMDQVNKNTGDVSNTGAGLSLNIVEQAKNDTNRIDLSKIDFNDAGDISPKTVRDFIKAMPDTERGNLIDKQGNPTKQAIERVDAAIFQQAYENDKLTELAFQAQDEEARNIVRALNMAASKAIRLGEVGDYDVRPLVNEAVELAINARRNNLSLSDAARQVDITANPLANSIIKMFADNPRSAKAIGENLSNLFDSAYAEGTKSGEDMFGAVPKRPVDQLIQESFAKKTEPDLFAQPVEIPAVKIPKEEPESKAFTIKKPMEQIAAEIGELEEGSQVSGWLVENAPNSAARAIAERIKFNIEALEQAGVPIKVEVLNGAKRLTYYGDSAYIAKAGNISYFRVRYNGLNSQGKAETYPPSNKPTGTRYSTIMHEMLHVISQIQLDTLVKRNFKGPEKVIYNELRSIYRAVEKQMDEDLKNLPRANLHPAVLRKGALLKNIDELWVRSLTEGAIQDYLSRIKMGKKTALTKLMSIFRKVIGLDPEYETALDRIMTVSDRIFAQTPEDIQRLAKVRGYRFASMKEQVVDESKPLKVRTDNPGGSWLTEKQTYSESKGRNEYGVPNSFGSVTGYFKRNVLVPVDVVARVKGMRGEQANVRDDSIKFLTDYMGKNDKFPPFSDKDPEAQYFPFIQVYQDGTPYVNEGNHRIMTAKKLGWKFIPLELRYFNGAELEDGPLSPAKIAEYDKQAREEGYSTTDYSAKPEQLFEEIPEIKYEDVAEEADKDKPTAQARNYLGKQIQANWAFPEDNVKHWPGLSDQSINDFLYKIQDKQIDTKRAQQAIEKAAGEIEENINVYEKEQLYHGRTATGIRKFLLDELMPAIKELGVLKLTPQDLKDYLYNRHAPERNNKMNEVNKLDPITGKERKTPWELQDRASGISTADARAYLANLEPAKKAALEKVAQRFDEMVQGTQQILLASGAEDKATIDAYNDTYKHYVPLFRIENDFTNTGGMGATGASKGFGVRGAFSKRAMGSEKEVQDILGNLIAQRERALIRAEKSRVGQALYGLALTNPNPDLWLPVNPDAIKSRDALVEELQSLGYKDAAQIADNLMEEPKSRYISKEKKQFVDPDTGLPMQVTEESVKLKLDNLKRFGDNVFPVRINGKDRYIFFNKNDPKALRMVHSLMNLDADSLGDIEGIIAKATRWFASVNTQYNPIFGVVNLIRDVGGATLNLSTTAIAGDQAKVNKNVIPAMRGILNVLRDERKGKTDTAGKWAKAFQDFREQGGQTGYRDSLIRTDEEKQIIEREINKMKSGNTKKAFYAVVGALSDFNDMMENSIRLSAYMAALDKGLSKQKAAILAKNLTVNFDKKGQLSARINAYFAFFNASVQGTARLAKTLKGPKGKAIIGGGIALGAAQAVILALAGYDDDNPPEFIRERNFIVPLPNGDFLTIPYPLGFNVLPNVGRLTTEFVLSGGKDPGKKVTALLGSVVDAFSPVGGSELSLQTISPTVVDPLVAIATNKDAFGRPIYKKDQATNPTPGYLRSRENASEFSKNISYFLNLASGGTKYSKGYVSPTGDEIDYLIGQITGGVGRELIKAEQTVKSGITGEELPAYRIPLVGRFYGETQSNAAESQRFYDNIIKMADYENEVKGRIKNKEPVGEYLRDNPQARFWRSANTVENQINQLNKQKKEFIEKGLPKERIKRIENQKAAIMKRFNDQIAKSEE